MQNEVGELIILVAEKGEVSIGEIALKFGWQHAKTSFMVGVALDTSTQVRREGRKLIYVPPKEEEEPEKEEEQNWTPFSKPLKK